MEVNYKMLDIRCHKLAMKMKWSIRLLRCNIKLEDVPFKDDLEEGRKYMERLVEILVQ